VQARLPWRDSILENDNDMFQRQQDAVSAPMRRDAAKPKRLFFRCHEYARDHERHNGANRDGP
jgi:hypothetical protein